MNNYINMIERSLLAKIMLAISAVFLISVAVATIYSYQAEKERALSLVKAQIQEQSSSIFDSLNMLMISGAIEDRNILKDKIKSSEGVLDVRFIRGDFIIRENGKGYEGETPVDATDHQMLKGEVVVREEVVEGEHVLTVATPFRATENTRGVNCLMCHQTTEGDILGGVRITASLEHVYSAIHLGLWKSSGLNILVFIFGLFFLHKLMTRLVVEPVKTASTAAKRIAEGNMGVHIHAAAKDEVGNLLNSLEEMQSVLIANIMSEKEEMLRIKTALDQVSGNVMIADADYRIFYINQKAKALMQDAEADFRKDLPNFRANELIGTCIDVFHKQPFHQRRLLDGLKGSFRSKDMTIGGRVMGVIANPVISADGTRIATVVEWIDRTEEARVETEVQSIVESAKAGDLTQRINTANKSGFFGSLSAGINELVEVCNAVIEDTLYVLSGIAEGKLTRTIDNEYMGSFKALKDNANDSVEKLKDLISMIRDIANDVSDGASELAGSNLTLNDRTQVQAAALEETASSIEEMTSTVQQNAQNSRQANQLAMEARAQAEHGGEVVNHAIEAMSVITRSSTKISDIISVIDDIAFQTNLLALNAAVEAARAGEQGKGFAVVAGEVRTLAQRSAEAAKEINGLINQSVESVHKGSELVDKSGEALGSIVQAVQKVGDIIAEIASAGQEQATGIEQINQAISQMDDVTQQNAALVEETAAGSEALEQKSSEMLNIVATFKLHEDNRKGGAA